MIFLITKPSLKRLQLLAVFFFGLCLGSCAMETDKVLTPAKYSLKRLDFERSFYKKSLDLKIRSGSNYCISYHSQECEIWVDGRYYKEKVCYTLTDSSANYFTVEISCDEKRDGVEESCKEENGGADLGKIGTLRVGTRLRSGRAGSRRAPW